jgi:hypothetical protein
MTGYALALLDRIAEPEYTGENRCVPCTIINCVLGFIASLLTVIVMTSHLGWIPSIAVGIGILLVATVTIYLRGYLVPGTPWLTQTYFPDRVLAWFDKLPEERATAGDPDGTEGVDVEATLRRAGAVGPCIDADDLCLADAFRDAWRAAVDDVDDERASRAVLARLLDVDPGDLELEAFGDARVARLGDLRAGQWESRAAFAADLAAADVLADRYDGWDALDVADRGRLLYGLRVFLERCPSCGGPVAPARETVESCCRSREVVAVACRDCGARLVEGDAPSPADEAA